MKRTFPILTVALAAALPLSSIAAFAQASAESAPSMASPAQPGMAPATPAPAVSEIGTGAAQPSSGPAFVKKISDDNTFEIEAAKIALEKSSLKELKRFAEHMVHDHTVAGDELKTAMAGEGVKMPSMAPLDPSNQDKIAKLKSMSGREFDASYVQMMVMGHEQDVAIVKTFLASTQDPRLKVFAERVLPVIENHLREIDKIRREEKMG